MPRKVCTSCPQAHFHRVVQNDPEEECCDYFLCSHCIKNAKKDHAKHFGVKCGECDSSLCDACLPLCSIQSLEYDLCSSCCKENHEKCAVCTACMVEHTCCKDCKATACKSCCEDECCLDCILKRKKPPEPVVSPPPLIRNRCNSVHANKMYQKKGRQRSHTLGAISFRR